MNGYFLDTNVVLDFLARREPFAKSALEIFRAGLENRAILYVASLSFSHLYYTLRKQTDATAARAAMAHLQRLVTVVAVDAATIAQAVAGPFTDFEDAIQYYSAAAIPEFKAIVTRDLRGFKAGVLPILTPEQALLSLASL